MSIGSVTSPTAMILIGTTLAFIVQIAYIMLLMLPANNAVLFATEYGKDEKLAVKTIFAITLAGFVL